jgi:hypothetical protein
MKTFNGDTLWINMKLKEDNSKTRDEKDKA